MNNGDPGFGEIPFFLSFLVGISMDESFDDGEAENFEVKAVGPVADVVQIVFDPLFERSVSAPSVHLGPARDPRLHFVTKHVLWDLTFELVHENGPLGPAARRGSCHL